MPNVAEKLLLADNEHAETQRARLSLTLLPSLVARTPHAANHHCDTHQAWIETTILIRIRWVSCDALTAIQSCS